MNLHLKKINLAVCQAYGNEYEQTRGKKPLKCSAEGRRECRKSPSEGRGREIERKQIGGPAGKTQEAAVGGQGTHPILPPNL